METIILLQFIAHIVSDFYCQPENWCTAKQEKGMRSRYMYLHILVVFAASIFFTFSVSFLVFAAIIALIHFIIDVAKYFISKHISTKNKPYLFIADQLLHFITIYVAVNWFIQTSDIPGYLNNSILTVDDLLLIIGLLLCLKPANVLIKIFLDSLGLPQSGNLDLERAGRWIGSSERILTYILVLLGQFTAIGFIITAKSILRYGDGALRKTEYVLIGTLMSFGMAVILGLGITSGFFANVLSILDRFWVVMP